VKRGGKIMENESRFGAFKGALVALLIEGVILIIIICLIKIIKYIF
jgi:hypothetical protein